MKPDYQYLGIPKDGGGNAGLCGALTGNVLLCILSSGRHVADTFLIWTNPHIARVLDLVTPTLFIVVSRRDRRFPFADVGAQSVRVTPIYVFSASDKRRRLPNFLPGEFHNTPPKALRCRWISARF